VGGQELEAKVELQVSPPWKVVLAVDFLMTCVCVRGWRSKKGEVSGQKCSTKRDGVTLFSTQES
jgi:hypothetical protein